MTAARDNAMATIAAAAMADPVCRERLTKPREALYWEDDTA